MRGDAAGPVAEGQRAAEAGERVGGADRGGQPGRAHPPGTAAEVAALGVGGRDDRVAEGERELGDDQRGEGEREGVAAGHREGDRLRPGVEVGQAADRQPHCGAGRRARAGCPAMRAAGRRRAGRRRRRPSRRRGWATAAAGRASSPFRRGRPRPWRGAARRWPVCRGRGRSGSARPASWPGRRRPAPPSPPPSAAPRRRAFRRTGAGRSPPPRMPSAAAPGPAP